jgi:hypothetical protein
MKDAIRLWMLFDELEKLTKRVEAEHQNLMYWQNQILLKQQALMVLYQQLIVGDSEPPV